MIQQTTGSNGRAYYSALRAGVQYTATCDAAGWHVYACRLALGRSNFGSVKRYESLAALAQGCKAFRGLDVLAVAEGAGA